MHQTEPAPIAVLGGTGPEGRGLALRWAAHGYPVIVGSRDASRARLAAAELADLLSLVKGAVAPSGDGNLAAARAARTVVLAVPYSAQAATLAQTREALSGKVLLSVVVPLRPPQVHVVRLPEQGSAAAEAQSLLGDDVRVVTAFQNVAAARLADLSVELESDVLVCGDDGDAKSVALDLVAATGAVGYDAGPLANAGVVEGLTAVLIGLNRRYGGKAAGVRITNLGLDRE